MWWSKLTKCHLCFPTSKSHMVLQSGSVWGMGVVVLKSPACWIYDAQYKYRLRTNQLMSIDTRFNNLLQWHFTSCWSWFCRCQREASKWSQGMRWCWSQGKGQRALQGRQQRQINKQIQQNYWSAPTSIGGAKAIYSIQSCRCQQEASRLSQGMRWCWIQGKGQRALRGRQ